MVIVLFCLYPVPSFFREINDRNYSRLLDFPLVVYSGHGAVTCSRPLFLLLKASESVNRGWYRFQSKGGQMQPNGGPGIHLVDYVGYTPPRFSQKGGPGSPSFAAAPFAPMPCPKKKRKYVRARHGLRVSCQRVMIKFRPFGASAGTFRGRVFHVPP